MTQAEQHTHSIERAAARLRAIGGVAPVAPSNSASEGADPKWLAEAAADQFLAPDAKHGTVIDEETLVRAGLVDWTQPHSRVVEELRIVQNQLMRQAYGENMVADGRSNLILVTSAVPDEGKSFVSLNLAAGFARQGGRRATLIDVDAKPAGLGHLLGRSAAPGLLDLARHSGLGAPAPIIRTAVEHLDVLTLGGNAARSAELLASARMVGLIEDLGRRYADRVIVLDAPPCLSSSVPHTLANIVGQVVFVVAAGSTQQDDIEAALDLVRACPRISLLLNKVPPWNAHSFGLYNYPLAQA